jgi:hypothetical protein
MSKQLLGIFAGVAGLAVMTPDVAEACSCLEPSVERSWHESTDMLRGTVLGVRQHGQMLKYKIEVEQPYSGCTQAGQVVVIRTPVSSAACGTQLEVGESYVLSATLTTDEPEVYAISACGFNRLVSSVDAQTRDYLKSRPVYCDETETLTCSSGETPVQCFANPCKTSTCEASTYCEFNPCAASPCTAEHYDSTWQSVECPVE